MKKLNFIFALFFVIVTISAQDKKASISTGDTWADLTFTAADTVNESDSLWIEIKSFQDYTTMQDVYVDIDSVSGTPAATITLWGKLTSADAYAKIGTAVSYGGTGDTTFTISNTSPNRYRYYKLGITTTATDQQILVSDVQFKQWFSGGSVSGSSITDGTATLTGGALSGVTTLTLENGLTVDNATNGKLEFNEASDELIWTFGSNTVTASSSDVTLFDYGIINLGTDALDVSDGDITNVGVISADSLKPDGTKVTLASGVTANNVAQVQVFETDDNGYTNALSATAGTAPAVVLGSTDGTVAIASNDWAISTSGAATGMGSITSDGIVTGGFKMLSTIINTDGSETLDVTMSGKTAIATKSDGATTFTIPDADTTIMGVVYYLLQTADQNLIVTATTANNNDFVCDGVATSDAVTISTASHLIGAGMIIIGIRTGVGTFKWYVGGLNPDAVLTPEAAD